MVGLVYSIALTSSRLVRYYITHLPSTIMYHYSVLRNDHASGVRAQATP